MPFMASWVRRPSRKSSSCLRMYWPFCPASCGNWALVLSPRSPWQTAHWAFTSAQFPQLAGQNGQYIRKQLDDFREGRRTHEAMNGIARSLNASQVQALASYFEAQAPVAHPPTDALLAGVGRYIYERGNIHARVPACVSCHKESGRGNAHLPRLAGQHPQYVENQLRRFHAKDRRNDAGPMAFVTDGLTELELRAVAAYVGGMTVPITRR
jgi:cytochrome c553